jgi:hypothetical protein
MTLPAAIISRLARQSILLDSSTLLHADQLFKVALWQPACAIMISSHSDVIHCYGCNSDVIHCYGCGAVLLDTGEQLTAHPALPPTDAGLP